MNDIIDYKKAVSTSNEPTGAIMIDNYLGKPTYTAVTVSTSKTFKSLKRAENFMPEFGYIKCN